jgi:ferredoxin
MSDSPRIDAVSGVSPTTKSKEQQVATLKEEAQSMREPLDQIMGWIDELEKTERGSDESTLRTKQKEEEFTARRVVIDEDECALCGSCVEICPEVFAIRKDAGAAVVIKERGGREDLIQDAIDSCPVQCISWER